MSKNDSIIRQVLEHAGRPMTRSEIQSFVSLPRTTIYDALERLQNNGHVTKYNVKTQSGAGRPYTMWRLN